MKIYDNMNNAYNTNKQYLPYGYDLSGGIIRRDVTNGIFKEFNNYKLYELTDTYNVPDEQRYLYGISYFYNNILHP
jgi:hypothetical protein